MIIYFICLQVTYGLDESDDNFSQRRTRGKKINYLENLGSDSEEVLNRLIFLNIEDFDLLLIDIFC